MTQEEKSLLLKDLCARLPYGIFVKENRESLDDSPTIYTFDYHPCIDNCKPYLRPISSITEEEERELNGLLPEVYDFTFRMEELLELIQMQKEIPFHYIDWLDKNKFDYRGLIEKGLALEAPEDMYKNI